MLGVVVVMAVLGVVDLAVVGVELVLAEADVCKVAQMVICMVEGVSVGGRGRGNGGGQGMRSRAAVSMCGNREDRGRGRGGVVG